MTSPILRLENVSKRFFGLSVIDDLCFSVASGSCTALIGPNGAGKTTVFNLITGVISIDAGVILLDEVDISRIPSRRRIRHGVSRSFQNIRLMPHLSAVENVMIGQHSRANGVLGILEPVRLLPGNRWREEARAALADAGLERYEQAAVGNLPYGIQKRIELVRALMARPRLLLLDEPVAGLNSAEKNVLREQLQSICSRTGVTLLLVEHDMNFVGVLCDTVVVLNFGRKIATGTPNEIRENPLVREAYLGAKASLRAEQGYAT